MMIQDDGDSLAITKEIADRIVHFKQRLPTTEEVNPLVQYCLKYGDTPWTLSSFSDQDVDKFHQHIIDNEQSNNLNTKSDYSSGIEVELVERIDHKFSYFDTSNAHGTKAERKHASLFFQRDTTIMNNVDDMNQIIIESFSRKALPTKINDENHYHIFIPFK
jgi:hypothetical protein